jgi:hypothetical protein
MGHVAARVEAASAVRKSRLRIRAIESLRIQ